MSSRNRNRALPRTKKQEKKCEEATQWNKIPLRRPANGSPAYYKWKKKEKFRQASIKMCEKCIELKVPNGFCWSGR